MTREKLLIALVICLVILNVVVLWRFNSGRPGGPPPHDKIIVKTLNFDEDQRRTFEELKFDHRSKINAIESKVENTLEQYFMLLENEDQSKKDSLEVILSDLERQKARVTYDHFLDLKNLCRPDQKKAFDEFVPQLSRFILPQGQKNRPRPPKD